jgi:hypothetical protein
MSSTNLTISEIVCLEEAGFHLSRRSFPCKDIFGVATPLLEECEDDTHIPEMGIWDSSGTLETSEFDYRGQNTSP